MSEGPSVAQRPIRVCEFVGNMNGGGVESVVMNYYRHVDRSKVQFDFVVTDASTIVPRGEMESLGARVFTVPAYANLPSFCRSARGLFRAHPEWRIVHAHMNALNVFPLREAARAGVPVRISHSHSTFGRGEPVRNAAKIVLKRFANIYPTERFACSRCAGDWLFGYGTPYEIVYNAFELDKFAFRLSRRKMTRHALGIANDSFVVGHVGRFMETKNQSFLLEAFARMLSQRPNSILVFAGTGDDEARVKARAAELRVADRVMFLGQREDVADLYQAFDVVALPSLYEGLGLVAIEAQVSGLPCLLSDRIPDETDVTGSCEYLPIDDPQVWAEALAATAPRDYEQRCRVDRGAFGNYDIRTQAAWLTNRYLQLAGDAR